MAEPFLPRRRELIQSFPRYYNPGVGRFLSEDPLRFDQGPNFYRYVQNNPLNWIDPSGTKICIVVTYDGSEQIPCEEDYIVVTVKPTGPSPPLIPVDDPWLYSDLNVLDQMSKCIKEQIEEINQIETEAANESLMSLPWVPGTSLGFQGLESILEPLWEGAGHVIPVLDYLFLGRDIVNQRLEYNKFKQRLRDAHQRECGCEQQAMGK
jgi:hypothetical protein